MAPSHATQTPLRHVQPPVTPVPSVVTLTRPAFETIQQTCRAAHDGYETGGILLGHQHDDRRLVVTTAGDPGPQAVRQRASFRRDQAHAQALADAAWSHDRSVWLGDWHTHPRGPVQPSPVDLRTYLALMRDPELGFSTFLALIVLPGTSQPSLFPWVITESEGVCLPLMVDAASK